MRKIKYIVVSLVCIIVMNTVSYMAVYAETDKVLVKVTANSGYQSSEETVRKSNAANTAAFREITGANLSLGISFYVFIQSTANEGVKTNVGYVQNQYITSLDLTYEGVSTYQLESARWDYFWARAQMLGSPREPQATFGARMTP